MTSFHSPAYVCSHSLSKIPGIGDHLGRPRDVYRYYNLLVHSVGNH